MASIPQSGRAGYAIFSVFIEGAVGTARAEKLGDARMGCIADLDAASYRRHALHAEDRLWPETNCYTDVLIELLHGLGQEPLAALAFTLGIDFEYDQWTFFKFPDSDLNDLYGYDIQELNVWRSLPDHIAEQIAAGRPVLVELDAYFLPDTRGSSYQQAHVKTTVAVNEIDIEGARLGYFHGQSYYTLGGADFSDIFQIEGLVHERMLPPYIEYVKISPRAVGASSSDLLDRSLALLVKHLARVPRHNPFVQFKARFRTDMEWLLGADIERFHAYSFATLRQYGACFELAASYLKWLGDNGVDNLETAERYLLEISRTAKAFQFQLARAMARRKPLDLTSLDEMAGQWEKAISHLRCRFSA